MYVFINIQLVVNISVKQTDTKTIRSVGGRFWSSFENITCFVSVIRKHCVLYLNDKGSSFMPKGAKNS